MCDAADIHIHTYIHTRVHTHRTTTITLAAHARQGLIMVMFASEKCSTHNRLAVWLFSYMPPPVND